MNSVQVKQCSEQLKKLLAEQHNALDASVRKQIEEIIEMLEVAANERDRGAALMVLLSISNVLRAATNIAELISKIGND
jgi:hypothetical protein